MKRLLASQDEIKAWVQENGCLVIGVGMLKGGTGKTTMTIFVALYVALMLGLKVCVIDTDDNSQSVDNWYQVREQRGEEVPFDLVSYDCNNEDGPDLDDVITQLKRQYDVIVVDSGGAGKEAYWELCQSAHMVLLPLAPSGFEYNRIPATVKQAARGGKANENRLKVFICLVKCNNGSTLREEGRAAIEVILENGIDEVDRSRIDLTFVGEDFEISGSPDYSRAWSETPKRTHLDEMGKLFRHTMKKGFAA
ncbi:division plane positioning ATPase MipZ [Streptomyces cellulosae]